MLYYTSRAELIRLFEPFPELLSPAALAAAARYPPPLSRALHRSVRCTLQQPACAAAVRPPVLGATHHVCARSAEADWVSDQPPSFPVHGDCRGLRGDFENWPANCCSCWPAEHRGPSAAPSLLRRRRPAAAPPRRRCWRGARTTTAWTGRTWRRLWTRAHGHSPRLCAPRIGVLYRNENAGGRMTGCPRRRRGGTGSRPPPRATARPAPRPACPRRPR
jgi:hypothetical protein